MYMCIICIVIKKCPGGHCHNSFMATGALGHTHVRLHVLDIQDPNKAQVNTKVTRMIIHRNIHTPTYICLQLWMHIDREIDR